MKTSLCVLMAHFYLIPKFIYCKGSPPFLLILIVSHLASFPAAGAMQGVSLIDDS